MPRLYVICADESSDAIDRRALRVRAARRGVRVDAHTRRG